MKPIYVIMGCIVMLLFPYTHTSAQNIDNFLSNKIVAVVHMQNEFSKGELSEESTADEIARINQIIETVDPENVVYLKAMHKVLNLTLRRIYVDEIIKDLDDRLKIVNDDIFIDHGGDIFNSEELEKYLQKRAVKQIVIVGRVVDECITVSALSGEKLGYDIFIIPDAIVGKSQKSKLKAINKMKDKGVEEISVDYNQI